MAEAANPFCRVTLRDRAPSSLANLLLMVTAPIWAGFLFLDFSETAQPGRQWHSLSVSFNELRPAHGRQAAAGCPKCFEDQSRSPERSAGTAAGDAVACPSRIIAAQKLACQTHFRRSLWILSAPKRCSDGVGFLLFGTFWISWIAMQWSFLGIVCWRDGGFCGGFHGIALGGDVARPVNKTGLQGGHHHGCSSVGAVLADRLPCNLRSAKPAGLEPALPKPSPLWFLIGLIVDAIAL